MPHGHQELTRDRDNSLGPSQVRFQSLKFIIPVGMVHNRCVGSIHHRSTEISSTSFGNSPTGMGHSAVVDTGTQSGISNQLFGCGEARDIPNGCQDRDGSKHGHTWQLDQEWHPFILGALLLQVGFDLLHLSLGKFERVEIRTYQELFGCRQRQLFPPRMLFRGKGFFREGQVFAVQKSVQSIGAPFFPVEQSGHASREQGGVGSRPL